MGEAVQVQLLGGFGVRVAGARVAADAWRLRKAQTLVKLLALQPRHQIHRDRVMDALWPHLSAAAARNNLHQVLHAARKAISSTGIDGAEVVGLHGDLVVLGSGHDLVTDLEQLEQAVRETEASGDRVALTRALDGWPAELLPEDAYEPWAQPHISRFKEWRSRLVMDLVEAHLDAGEPELALALLAPVVSADPLHEPAHRAMIRALAAAGRRSEALLVFERLRTVLDELLAAEPEPETRQVVRDLLTADGPEPVGAPSTRDTGDLPSPLTTLVGRARELSELEGMLARTRLLTLTGPGGAGKTTLAVELARRRAADYHSGVYLVELAALDDGDLVVAQVARSFGLDLHSHPAGVESLVAQLRHHQALLVLDNCEHLLDECARVVAGLLRGCAGLSVLATSREPLRTEGEVAWRTPSLGVPDLAHLPGLDELTEIASVELFVQRAAASVADFRVTPGNAQAVAEICYRLDGIPLALELAAACIPVLTPEQIAGRLDDALSVLRRGDRATVTRQRTLAATLEWSHDLLDDDERVLFRRLSVFAGSFTLDAVESVCGPERPSGAVLVELARLVDTSLVVTEARGDTTRYRLLETVRQYAAEQLKASGEQHELQMLHCRWYLELAQRRDPERSPGPVDVVPASLDVEHDNMRAALSFSLRHLPDIALQLAVALWRYWLARGLFAEGCRWVEAALAAAPEPSALRARALAALAVFDVRRGSGHRLAALGAEAVAIHSTLDDPAGLAWALHHDAVLAYMSGRWTECWQRILETREVAADCRADDVDTAALHLRAMVLLARGELSDAHAAFEQVLADLDRIPGTTPPFFSPVTLGFAVHGTATASPRIHFEETVLLGRHVGAGQSAGYVRCDLADLARLSGELDTALTMLQEALSRFVALGDRDGQAFALSRVGCLHRVRGEFREGRDALEHSLRLRREIGDRRAIGLTLVNLGVLSATEGHVERGRALLNQALGGFGETEDVPGLVGLALTTASVSADGGAYGAAEQQLVTSLPESHHIPGNHRTTAWAYAMLADVCRRQGRLVEADRALKQAGQLFDALGAVDGAAHVRTALQSRR